MATSLIDGRMRETYATLSRPSSSEFGVAKSNPKSVLRRNGLPCQYRVNESDSCFARDLNCSFGTGECQ